MNRVALAVGQYLDFHVAWVAEEFLQIHHRVAKRRAGFGAGQFGGLDQIFLFMHHAHAATTAAASGFDDHWIAHFAGDAQGFLLVFWQWAVGARHGRYAGLFHRVFGRDFIAHQANHVGGWADKGKPGALNLLGKIGVLGQKAVAGVDGVGAGDFRRGNDRGNA